jgi:thiol-disulfide isomerase/thioredoxin
MKILQAFTAILFMSFTGMAQTHIPDVSKNDRGEIVYNGFTTFDDLEQEPTFTWLGEGAKEYQPDGTQILYLSQRLPLYNMVVVMGTWCEDSHNMVPKLYKVLAEAEYPMDQLKMYGVDRDKHSKTGEHERYKVTNVPVIILLRDGKEIGRITEMVNKSVEADLVQIIAKDK